MTHKPTADGAAIVTPDIHWRRIDSKTPLGSRMLLIERAQNIAFVRIRQTDDKFDHWLPLPTFPKDDAP